MGLLQRRRTWRTLAAIPLGLALGWMAAGYAQPAGVITVEPPPASEQLRDDGVGDEEPPAAEPQVRPRSLHHPEADEAVDR